MSDVFINMGLNWKVKVITGQYQYLQNLAETWKVWGIADFIAWIKIPKAAENLFFVYCASTILIIIILNITAAACDRQLSESKQKVSSLTEQLERKVAAADSGTHGSENGPDDTSVLKVSTLPVCIAVRGLSIAQRSILTIAHLQAVFSKLLIWGQLSLLPSAGWEMSNSLWAMG